MTKKKSPMLWITDPWHTLDHPKDTTLRLMEEASLLGVQQFWCDVKSIHLVEKGVFLQAKPILSISHDRGSNSVEWGTPVQISPEEFSSLHYRPDPPVDLAYLHPLHLLALGLGLGLGKANSDRVVNPLDVLFCRNEKMEAAAIKGLMPPSIVSSQWDRLVEFGKQHQRTVLKPLHEAQSHGIELLDWRKEDSLEHARLKLAVSTQQFQVPVLLQAYLEGIAEGETRLWFLDGKLLAHARKLPVTGDFRVDIDRGSRLTSASLSKLEKTRTLKISRHLKERRIRLAAVDLIEGFVTDFNFTSPGLIIQMEALLNKNLARPIIEALRP